MINPEILKLNLNEEVLKFHSRGLSPFGISTKLHIPYWEAQRIIESELKKEFNTLFN